MGSGLATMTEEVGEPLNGIGGRQSASATSSELPEICLRLEVITELPLPLAAIPRRRDYSHCQKRRFVVRDDPEFLLIKEKTEMPDR
jgi:hypothetical protein